MSDIGLRAAPRIPPHVQGGFVIVEICDPWAWLGALRALSCYGARVRFPARPRIIDLDERAKFWFTRKDSARDAQIYGKLMTLDGFPSGVVCFFWDVVP